jgi:hypothetical protein
MRGDRGLWIAGARPSGPCCTGSSLTRFPPARHAVREVRSRTLSNAANAKWRSCGSVSNSTGACNGHTAHKSGGDASQAIVSAASGSCRWRAGAVSSFVARRADITQERGEHRDRCRVLNALRETMPGPGAPRIIRAGLPDRGALLVTHGLPCAATVRARPVRPSRRRCPRVTGGRARQARNGTTPGTVTHRDRFPGGRARQRPPLTPIARPAPAYCRRCRLSLVRVRPVLRTSPVTSAPSSRARQSASHRAWPAVSRASAVSGEPAGPLSAEGASGQSADSITGREVVSSRDRSLAYSAAAAAMISPVRRQARARSGRSWPGPALMAAVWRVTARPPGRSACRPGA